MSRQLVLLSADELDALLDIRAKRRRSSPLEEAALRYVSAVLAHDSASVGRAASEALLECEAALHDLIVTAGRRCPYCDPLDTCPGTIGRSVTETRPLEEWQDERDRDAEDRGRLLAGDIDRT